MAILSGARAGADGRGRGFWRRLHRLIRALDDHWVGDLIGVASLFAMLWAGLVAGWVLQ